MSNTRRTFFNRLGINTTKLPQTAEEFEKVHESLRNPKSGITLEIQPDENNCEKHVFNGTFENLVSLYCLVLTNPNRKESSGLDSSELPHPTPP